MLHIAGHRPHTQRPIDSSLAIPAIINQVLHTLGIFRGNFDDTLRDIACLLRRKPNPTVQSVRPDDDAYGRECQPERLCQRHRRRDTLNNLLRQFIFYLSLSAVAKNRVADQLLIGLVPCGRLLLLPDLGSCWGLFTVPVIAITTEYRVG